MSFFDVMLAALSHLRLRARGVSYGFLLGPQGTNWIEDEERLEGGWSGNDHSALIRSGDI